MKAKLFLVPVVMSYFSCNSGPSEKPVPAKKTANVIQKDFTFENKKDSVKVINGEQIHYHKNGVIEMRGMMKDNKRDGLWKSWYENGLPWSETTFSNGKKNGKTTTWYENGNKRYEGFFTNDRESGRWTFWKEDGTIMDFKNYDLR
jgi:antitoxin component YwqK of YwqJK toxin-antitoxin module